MSRGTSFAVDGRTRKGLTLLWVALFVFSLLLQSVRFAAPSSAIAASGLLADTVQGFEVDGDLLSGDGSTVPNPAGIPDALIHNPPMAAGDDWLQGASHNNVVSLPNYSSPTAFLYTDAVDPGDNSAYGGGNKEDDTRDWVYVNSAGPNPKTDFKHIMAHARMNNAGTSAFAFLGAERIVNNGTMVVDFELNQKPFKQFSVGPLKPDRTNGDLLISLEYSNGGGNPIVTLYNITNVVDFPQGQTNDFAKVNDQKTIDAVRSATNFVDLTNSGFGYTVPAFDFAEASIDLSALDINTGCPGFSSGHIRSRTGGDPGNSQLKDAAPAFPIDLNNCGKITIIKDAVPNSAQDFDFATTGSGLSAFKLDDDSDNTLSDTKVFNDVAPGAYTITEAAVSGWKLTNLVCNDANGSVDLNAGKATLNVGPNEEITCTYTNTKLGKIIVEKQTLPDGSPGSFAFTGDAAGSIGDNGQIVVDNLVPGTYTSTEGNPAPPFDLGSIACDDANSTGNVGTRTATFHLEAGETVKCTFTNVKRGTITIIKDAVPNDPQDFGFTTTGSGLSPFSLDDDADATLPNNVVFSNVVPGDFSVTETDVAGWELTGLVCSGTGGSTGVKSGSTANITLTPGGSATCTYTNTKAGRIIIDKVTNPAADPASFEFHPSYGANFFLTDAASPNNSGDLKAGTYSVAELAKAGWDLTGTSCSDGSPVTAIVLGAGETVTCTFTNTKRGTIIVEKQTSPDGASGSFAFTGDAAGSIGDGQHIVVNNLVPGTYTSTEAAATGWDLGAIVCDDANSTGNTGTRTATFHLEAGETVTCVFTNVQRGTITIIKDAKPDSAQDFTYSATGSGLSGFSLDDDDNDTLSNMKTFANLLAGSYSVTEGAVGGWDLTSIDCTKAGGSTAVIDGATANMTLTSGGSITCVYVNSKPSITIVKTAGTAADGVEFVTPPGPVTYHYIVTNTGPVSLSGIVVIDDNGTPANTADDFAATCPKTTLAAGESMTCTKTVTVTANRTNVGTVTGTSAAGTHVTDSDDAVVRIPGINIDKTADDHLVEPNQTVTYTLKVKVVNGPVYDAVVEDTLPVGQTFVAGSASPSQPTVSANGRTLTWNLGTLTTGDPAVTITYDVTIDANATTAPQKNVAELCVSVTQEPQEGSAICDSDDETVTPQKPGIDIVKTAGDAEDGEVYSTEPGNVTYTYVVTNTGPLPLGNVTVTDDNGTPGTGDDFKAICPRTTLAAKGDPEHLDVMTCMATVTVTADRTNVATARGFTAEGNPVEAKDDADVAILVHGLVIAKSNDAPIATLELPDGSTADLPTADEGSTVTYTLHYTFSGDPVTHGIITDVLPEGLTYVDGSATSNAQFIFQAYDTTTRTLTWKAATVTASGTLTYKVTVDVGASELTQPLENVATIDSDQTEPADDTADVFVPVIPQAETSKPTPPPTDILVAPEGPSTTGFSLLLILAVLGGLVLTLGLITPVPAVVRRRNRR